MENDRIFTFYRHGGWDSTMWLAERARCLGASGIGEVPRNSERRQHPATDELSKILY